MDNRSKEERVAIATEILNQLGGNRFITMTGAKHLGLLSGDFGLGFKVAGGQYIRIVLNSMDLYDVERFKMRNYEKKDVKEEKGIYNDMLQSAFTRLTGLETHL